MILNMDLCDIHSGAILLGINSAHDNIPHRVTTEVRRRSRPAGGAVDAGPSGHELAFGDSQKTRAVLLICDLRWNLNGQIRLKNDDLFLIKWPLTVLVLRFLIESSFHGSTLEVKT